MRLAQTEVFVHLEVQLDEEAPILLLRREIVDGKPFALGQRANRFEKVLAFGCAGFHVHHDVGGDDGADALFNGVAERMDLLEAGAPGH